MCEDVPGATRGLVPTLPCRYLQLHTHLAVKCACACLPSVLHLHPQQTEGFAHISNETRLKSFNFLHLKQRAVTLLLTLSGKTSMEGTKHYCYKNF